ncbi:10748_t:CDS:2 [Diversispora eburnea]|uniref:10748_t:CDS:1 n=1 Tax=Diversispora eburnea TaxID=1213867 RepID=A0A9N9FT89_9GLOM|nr:10748_t:CDS:2 [Diversispora eburnea]
MSCSFALEVCPRIAEVEMLVASHMTTAIGISDDRTDILCTYPSDPILASGALKGIIEVGFENCLDTLLERGVVKAGERGELFSRILFLEAYIRAVRKNLVPPIIYLEKMNIDQAEISFNHWTYLLASNKQYVNQGGQKYLSENLIREAYHRHTAFKMPLGFPYEDVPVLVHPKSAFYKNFNGIILGINIDIGTFNPKIRKRLFKLLFTSPWPLDPRWSMINVGVKKQLDRTNAIKSFLPLVFKQEQSLVNKWHL